MEYTYLKEWAQCVNLPRIAKQYRWPKASRTDPVVVNMGNNDYTRKRYRSPELEGMFLWAYHNLLKRIRLYHPQSRIVVMQPLGRVLLCMPNVNSGDICNGTNSQPEIRIEPTFGGPDIFRQVVDNFKQKVDDRIYLLETKGWLTPDNAEDLMEDGVHPSYKGLVVFGEKVGEYLKELKKIDP